MEQARSARGGWKRFTIVATGLRARARPCPSCNSTPVGAGAKRWVIATITAGWTCPTRHHMKICAGTTGFMTLSSRPATTSGQGCKAEAVLFSSTWRVPTFRQQRAALQSVCLSCVMSWRCVAPVRDCASPRQVRPDSLTVLRILMNRRAHGSRHGQSRLQNQLTCPCSASSNRAFQPAGPGSRNAAPVLQQPGECT